MLLEHKIYALTCNGLGYSGAQYNHMHVCTFSADEVVTGGSVNVSVVYNNILPIYKHTFDLCELVQDTKKSCPVPKGIFDITVDTKVPKGVYAVSIGKKWFCLFTFHSVSFNLC